MPDELPNVDELLRLVEGAAPIAVVPVGGVVLVVLPGVVGPPSMPVAAPLVAPGVVVLAIAPVLGNADDAVVELPSVDEPSVEAELFVLPHGCEMPGDTVCANAAPVHAASAPLRESVPVVS